MKSNLFLLLAALLCAATFAQAQTEKRLALVIGNAAYNHATILDNAVNDAYSMRDALQSVGFEVICKTNLNYTQMDDEINAFVRKLANYDAGLVFFAGHGCNPDDGSDYLLPIEARGDWLLPQIRKNAISVQYVEDMMGAVSKNAKKSNILILDACRNNMLVRSLNRDVIDSWQPPKSASSAQGTLVAYGAAKGQKASDGRGNNGLFTSKLIKHLKTPNLAITEVFRRVRGEVFDECKEQIPEVRDRLFEIFIL